MAKSHSLKLLAWPLFALALIAPPASLSQAFGRLDVIVRPFESAGEAEPDFTKMLQTNIAQAIERQSDYRVVSGGAAHYYLKGRVLSDDKRHVLTIQLFKNKTDRVVWVENYDYRKVAAGIIADDIIEVLSSVPAADTWN